MGVLLQDYIAAAKVDVSGREMALSVEPALSRLGRAVVLRKWLRTRFGT